jgi:hypothetical protein
MHHHPWVAELTRSSLQLPIRVLFCIFYYVLFVAPGYALHTRDSFHGIPFDIDPQDNASAKASDYPYSFFGKSGSFCIDFVSICLYVPFGILRQNNTSAWFANENWMVNFYRNVNR